MSLRDTIRMSKEEITSFLQNQISLQIRTLKNFYKFGQKKIK